MTYEYEFKPCLQLWNESAEMEVPVAVEAL